MSMLKEFKEFAMRGNVVDLAVGVIIGAAFGGVVKSVVDDLMTPLIGIVAKKDFSNLYVPLSDKITSGLPLADAKKLGPVFAYGNFITMLINFLIVAFCVFLIVKLMNRLWKKPEPEPAGPTTDQKLLMEIRDELRARR